MSRNDQLLRRAIASLHQGNHQDAQMLLKAILREDPKNEIVWKWYVDSFPSREGKRRACQMWLNWDRGNPTAVQWLHRYDTRPIHFPVDPQPKNSWFFEKWPIIGLASALVIVSLVAVWLFTVNQVASATVENNSAPLQQSFLNQTQIRNYESTIALQSSRIRELEQDLTAVTQQRDQFLQQFTEFENSFNLESTENETLVAQVTALQETNTQLAQDNAQLQTQVAAAEQEAAGLRQTQSTPSAVITNQNITFSLERHNGRIYRYTMPYDQLNNSMFLNYQNRNYGQRNIVVTTDDGMSGAAIDYRHYVNPAPFEAMMTDLMSQAVSEVALMQDAWRFSQQLTMGKVTIDLEDTPRFPLDTLVQGHGDNDDKAILLASLLLAAPVSWDVSFLYMDMNYHEDPHAPNHLIVHVTHGVNNYYLDPTSTTMQPYSNKIVGWEREIIK